MKKLPLVTLLILILFTTGCQHDESINPVVLKVNVLIDQIPFTVDSFRIQAYSSSQLLNFTFPTPSNSINSSILLPKDNWNILLQLFTGSRNQDEYFSYTLSFYEKEIQVSEQAGTVNLTFSNSYFDKIVNSNPLDKDFEMKLMHSLYTVTIDGIEYPNQNKSDFPEIIYSFDPFAPLEIRWSNLNTPTNYTLGYAKSLEIHVQNVGYYWVCNFGTQEVIDKPLLRNFHVLQDWHCPELQSEIQNMRILRHNISLQFNQKNVYVAGPKIEIQ